MYNNDSMYLEEIDVLSNKEMTIINSNRSIIYKVINSIVKKFHENEEGTSNKYFQKL